MLGSGVAVRTEVDTDFDDDQEARVAIMVHDIKPPFLDGRVVFTTQMELVSPIKDPTSDFATLSRKGSALMREVRERKERAKCRAKFWDVRGTAMGNAIGLKDDEAESETRRQQKEASELRDDGSVDYKKDSQFASHMSGTGKDAAVSHFARTKTIAEQREYLPIYQCRSHLLQLVHDNPVVVVVGETGSGKTTQLTQYLMEDGTSASPNSLSQLSLSCCVICSIEY